MNTNVSWTKVKDTFHEYNFIPFTYFDPSDDDDDCRSQVIDTIQFFLIL
jgi:hypothetical protein